MIKSQNFTNNLFKNLSTIAYIVQYSTVQYSTVQNIAEHSCIVILFDGEKKIRRKKNILRRLICSEELEILILLRLSMYYLPYAIYNLIFKILSIFKNVEKLDNTLKNSLLRELVLKLTEHEILSDLKLYFEIVSEMFDFKDSLLFGKVFFF